MKQQQYSFWHTHILHLMTITRGQCVNVQVQNCFKTSNLDVARSKEKTKTNNNKDLLSMQGGLLMLLWVDLSRGGEKEQMAV